jgi:RNA polymerase sigma-70 factor (ECF subfamily)
MSRSAASFSDEKQLWRAFRSGDSEAYAQLYDAYFEVLYRYGKKITSDTFLVEDCIQDLFVALWRNRETLSDLMSPKFTCISLYATTLLPNLRVNNPSI